ncbi:MAG: class I SAM-dependent methyltransferase [Flavobacteriaceae bacterium]
MKLLLTLLFICAGFTSQLYPQYNSSDWRERDAWMDTDRILDLAGVSEGQNVADIGCHEGYLSMHLARAVGVRGKVYAVDLREDRLETLNENASQRDIYNITTIKGEPDDPKLPEGLLDLVVIMDTYHEMKEYMTILEHVKRSLKPNGRIVILEKLKFYAKKKNRNEQVSAHTLSAQFVRKELQQAGFKVIEQINNIGNWENDTSKKIWILVGILPDA